MKKIALVLACCATSSLLGIGDKSWSEPMDPFYVAGPIYYVGTRGLAVYLIKTDAGLILLNTGLPGSEEPITVSIKKLGFDIKDVKLHLISHAHFDHVGALAALRKQSGAPVAVMKADVDLLKSGGKADYLFAKQPDLHFAPVNADRVLRDGENLRLGNVELIPHATPGHTPGCTTWEVVFTEAGRPQKAVFMDGTGINDGTRFVKNPSYPGIKNDFDRTYKVLESLKPDIFLSYHAEVFDLLSKRARMDKEGSKVWLDPNGYKSTVKAKKERFQKLVNDES